MRSLKSKIGAGVVGLIIAGLFAATTTGCDESEYAAYYEGGYYDDYSGGYDSGGSYTGSDVLETYLSDFVVY